MNVKEYIKNTFLSLTSETYPFGTEDYAMEEMILNNILPKEIKKDSSDNYFYEIGDSSTIFACHLDNACKENKRVNHVIEGNKIKTDGKTILGADDKAGVTILSFMIKNNIPGLYYFFVGEEVGCIGSALASKESVFRTYSRIISFDRRGLSSVITFQSSKRCCSDEFADELAKQLNLNSELYYKKDDGGIYTDSAEFTGIIPECTNLSVGYYNEHTISEYQDIDHLTKLAQACLNVNWEELPTKRNVNSIEYKPYSHNNYNHCSSNRLKAWNNNKNWKNDYKRSEYDYGYSADVDTINDPTWDDDYGYDPVTKRYYKKTRRSSIKKGKSFYDGGKGLIVPIEKKINKELSVNFDLVNIYEPFTNKIIKDDLTTSDLETIKEQYFDMNDENDKMFYDYLKGNII